MTHKSKRPNPLLKMFVDDVATREPMADYPDLIVLRRDGAQAAAEYIDSRLAAASAGGNAARGKSGRKIENKTRRAELCRERVRKHRAKKDSISVPAE